MRLASERPEEGVVVLTDSQTAGKGRQGRRWMDITGCNVLSSTILRPRFPLHLLVMLASLAVVDAIVETSGVAAVIKWPNDVLVGERKVAGILIETSHDREGHVVAILGIGVNVNGRSEELLSETSPVVARSQAGRSQDQDRSLQTTQAALVATATTLEAECGYVVSREVFIGHLLEHIETHYLALQQEALEPSISTLAYGPISRLMRERWRSYLSTLGCVIQVRQGETLINGIAEDVDENGELLLRLHSGELVSITWGDVGHPTR